MRSYKVFFLLFIFVLTNCEENQGEESVAQCPDTCAPVIRLLTDSVETILLQVSSTTLISGGANTYTWLPGNSTGDYQDCGVSILDVVDGEQLRCVDLSLETTGSVNNKIKGDYVLTYNSKDAAGNKAKTVKRIVRVIENEITFLNGDYFAVCTCTALLKDSKVPVISTSQYTTNVSASTTYNNQFDLSHMKIGSSFVRPGPVRLENNKLEVGFYDPAFHMSGNVSSGSLSASKPSFTIETIAYLYSPVTKYTCKNVFKKINDPNTIK